MDREKFKYLRQFGWAPGDYFITCGNCNSQATGDKRAICCRPCAQRAFDIFNVENVGGKS